MSEPTEIQAALRLGLRRLAKAVVVVACRWDGVRFAMTATAVSELSLDPPSLLVCVNKTASMHGALAAGSGFSINILRSSQGAVAAQCTGPNTGEQRFASGSWSEDGAPFLTDAQAVFLCDGDAQIEYGTHTVFIGRVVRAFCSGDVDPLVYVDGRFTALAESLRPDLVRARRAD